MATAYKYRRTVYALMLCLSLALLTTPSATRAKVSAQSQDSLHDKLDFLKEKLERYLSHPVGGEFADLGNLTFESVSFETCKITWKISTEFGHGADVPAAMKDLTMVNRVNVNLSSIDAARTKIYVMEQMKQRNIPWSLVLQLSTRPGTPGFTQQMVTTRRGEVTRTPVLQERQFSFFFNLRDQRIAEDVSKVFADASAICRSTTPRAR
jgi:hypothetical protein